MPYFNSDHTNIYYEIKGSGFPVLMIAGMASDANSWQFILNGLTDHFRLIMFDNRGCGRTRYKGSFKLRDIADDAYKLVDSLGYDKVHVIGHSMGGMIAQEFALAYPDRLDKIVLSNTSPRLSENAKEILRDLYQKWLDGYDMADWFRLLFKGLFTKEAQSNKKFIDAAIIFALSYPYPQTIEGFKDQVDAISSFDSMKHIGQIKHNTLVVSSSEDILIPPAESKQLLNVNGKSSFSLIEKAAHSIHAEKPGEFVRIVREFLDPSGQ